MGGGSCNTEIKEVGYTGDAVGCLVGFCWVLPDWAAIGIRSESPDPGCISKWYASRIFDRLVVLDIS